MYTNDPKVASFQVSDQYSLFRHRPDAPQQSDGGVVSKMMKRQ
jgi:hypothetical protein